MAGMASSLHHFLSRTLAGKALLRLALLGAAMLLLFDVMGAWVMYRKIEKKESERRES